MMDGYNIICTNDGYSIYRVCITMRTNVILGGDSNNKFIDGHTIYRGINSTMTMGGL